MQSAQQDIQALEALVVGNDDLERVEVLLNDLNLFEAIGVARQELRHSDFLAFLLDPHQPHGLGDSFAKGFMQRSLACAAADETPIRPVDVALMDLSEMTVRREWQNIDILLLDERNRLVVVVENKVGSQEHSDQLSRYYGTAQRWFPKHRLVGVFLTPEGDAASHQAFAPLSYETVCQLVEQEAERHGSTGDIGVLLRHYAQMLRRNVVSNSEIARLCRRIYAKHGRAIDLINQWRVESRKDAGLAIQRWVHATPGLLPDASKPGIIRFAPAVWDTLPMLRTGSGYTKSGRLLMFEFWTDDLAVRLKLGTGPEDIHQRLIRSLVETRCDLVHLPEPSPTPRLYWRSLAPDDGEALDWEAQFKENWDDFVATDLPVLVELVCGLDWLSEEPAPQE